LGNRRYRYDPAHYLIFTAALPISTWITEAPEQRPYLGPVLKLDPTLVGSVLVEVGHIARQRHAVVTSIDVSPLDANLLDAVVRLVRLLQSPTDTCFLAPPVTREIVYWLLRATQGERLHQIAALGGNSRCIAEAAEWLRKDFDQPLRIEKIARELGMSISNFNHHFRALTTMSSLQFQKPMCSSTQSNDRGRWRMLVKEPSCSRSHNIEPESNKDVKRGLAQGIRPARSCETGIR
jgi:hypothetical protein